MVEHRTLNPLVVGSSPTALTILLWVGCAGPAGGPHPVPPGDDSALYAAPDLDACATEDGLRAEIARQITPQVDHLCIVRPTHFPGVSVIGDAATDAGCVEMQVHLDCALATAATPAQVLERAGWSRATTIERERIAAHYLDEVVMAGQTHDDILVREGGDGTIEITTHDTTVRGPAPVHEQEPNPRRVIIIVTANGDVRRADSR